MSLQIQYLLRSLIILSLGLNFASYPASSSENQLNKTIDWIDLLPTHVDRVALMEHYADLVIQRLDPPDDPNFQAKIMTEFAQAPTNPSLNGKPIRLAGYMVVLENREDRITEFLLVPYSGAGLHQPAPPTNQMILVRVQPENALVTSQEYESVWVEGRLKIETNLSSIAPVAYLLEAAQVSLYTAEDAKQAEAKSIETTHNQHEHKQGHAEETIQAE